MSVPKGQENSECRLSSGALNESGAQSVESTLSMNWLSSVSGLCERVPPWAVRRRETVAVKSARALSSSRGVTRVVNASAWASSSSTCETKAL